MERLLILILETGYSLAADSANKTGSPED